MMAGTMQVSSKLRRGSDCYFWRCPACEKIHPLPDGWKFDGNLEMPTFHPSFKHDWTWGEEKTPHRCHYNVLGGQIRYCGDCTHEMAGKTVPMPDLPEPLKD